MFDVENKNNKLLKRRLSKWKKLVQEKLNNFQNFNAWFGQEIDHEWQHA